MMERRWDLAGIANEAEECLDIMMADEANSCLLLARPNKVRKQVSALTNTNSVPRSILAF